MYWGVLCCQVTAKFPSTVYCGLAEQCVLPVITAADLLYVHSYSNKYFVYLQELS